jgi:hypothetical protein
MVPKVPHTSTWGNGWSEENWGTFRVFERVSFNSLATDPLELVRLTMPRHHDSRCEICHTSDAVPARALCRSMRHFYACPFAAAWFILRTL